MSIILPPREVFEADPETVIQDDTERIARKGYGFGGWTETRCPPEGGMYAYYEGLLHPYKGHPWAQAVEANNQLKRHTLALFVPLANSKLALPAIVFACLPWKWKIEILEGFLENYCREADFVMWRFYFGEAYYNKCSRQLWIFSYHFLMNLGVAEELAYRTGKVIATMIEWDDAYRLPLEDLFTLTSKEKMTKNLHVELNVMAEALTQRATDTMAGKFGAFIKLFSAILYLPKLKKAFLSALSEVKFEDLQLDEIDYYHVLGRYDYKFLGRELEDRWEERRKMEVTASIQFANH